MMFQRKGALLLLILVLAVPSARADDPQPSHCTSLDLPKAWTGVERDVWARLCTTGLADLNAGDTYGGSVSPFEATAFHAHDRTLGQDFLATILGSRSFAVALADGAIELRGVDIPKLALDSPLLKKLVISGSRLGNVDIEGPDMAGMLDIDGSTIGQLKLGYGRIRGISLSSCTISLLQIRRLDVDFGLYLELTKADQVDIALSKFHAGATFQDSAVGAFNINSSAIEGAVAFRGAGYLTRAGTVDSQISGPLYLSELRWDSGSALSLDNTTVARFQFSGERLPDKLRIVHLGFSSWPATVGDTEALLDRLDASGSYDPALLQKVSDTYRDDGDYKASARLLYLKGWHDLEADGEIWSRLLRFVSWITVGFGIYPARGFLWFAGIVLLGTVVFSTGKLEAGERPRTWLGWLAFCLDAIVPGISFDEKHKEIRFSGWRKAYLYGMRASGAVLLFLVFKYLEAALPSLGAKG